MSRQLPLIIALHGVDGTGKSTQATLLAKRLSAIGVPAVVIWNRWTPRAVGFVRDVVRRTLAKSRGSVAEEQPTDRVAHAVARRPIVGFLFARIAWLEYLIQTRWRLHSHSDGAMVVVLDRYVADMVVDRARRLAWDDSRIAREVELAYRRGFPRPALTLFLDTPLEVVVERRPEEQPQALDERGRLYRRVADALGVTMIDARGNVESVAECIWELVDVGIPAARTGRR